MKMKNKQLLQLARAQQDDVLLLIVLIVIFAASYFALLNLKYVSTPNSFIAIFSLPINTLLLSRFSRVRLCATP